MTIRMKKLLTTLLMLTCVFGLTACGQEVKSVFDGADVQQSLKNQALVAYDYVSTTDADMEDAAIFTEEQLEELANEMRVSGGIDLESEVVNYGPITTGSAVVTGINSYRNSIKELGLVSDVNSADVLVEQKDKEFIVSIPLKGSIHNGSFEVIYDRNLHATSFTTNVEYTMAESMKKAGTNTLIGMGTVFAMLIVIMFIIYGFAVIPKIQASAEAKKQAKTATEASVDNAIQGIVEREEDVTDDLELVAVIAAAIAASEGATSTDGFVVRSIKRIR